MSSSTISSSLFPQTRLTFIPKSSVPNLVTTKQTNLKFPTNFNRNHSLNSLLSISTQKNISHHHHNKHHKTPIQSLFTGIVEELGEIKQLAPGTNGGFDMKIGAKTILKHLNLGDSIAVNGTCLTVTSFDKESSEFIVGLAPETLRKTSFIELQTGSAVNLERALQPSTRMGGHFVQGHVDGTGEIMSMVPEGDSLWIKVKTAPEILKYIVPKGFIAVDGTSLTVVDVFDEDGCFNFMLVAYTQQNVVIPGKKIGQKVNLEVDILGKYVERLLSSGFVEGIKARSIVTEASKDGARIE